MKPSHSLPPTALRVQRTSPTTANEAIRRATDATVARYEGASEGAIAQRLADLDREWDVERVLQANAGTLALAGTLAGALVDRRFLVLPAAVFTFFMQHALQGWCPPVPVFRRMGIRTAQEIARERYALKVMRGDFDDVAATHGHAATVRARAVLDAIDR